MKRPANRHPCNHFEKRVRRLAQLYDFSCHSFSIAVKNINAGLSDGSLDPRGHIPSNYGFVEHHHVMATRAFAQHQFPLDLRCTLLIRLVAEFEVCLVSSVEYLSLRSGTHLRPDATASWPRGKIMQFRSMSECYEHLLKSDLREMTSGGLRQIRKYYQKHMGFDVVSTEAEYAQLEEIHERRHLHVHRGGEADEAYVHKHGGVRVGEFLDIDEEYLRRAMSVMVGSTQHVKRQGQQEFPETHQSVLPGGKHDLAEDELILLCEAQFSDVETRKTVLDPERPLLTSHGQATGHRVGDYVHSILPDGNFCEWTIVGTQQTLTVYFGDLKQYQLSGNMYRFRERRLTSKD